MLCVKISQCRGLEKLDFFLPEPLSCHKVGLPNML